MENRYIKNLKNHSLRNPIPVTVERHGRVYKASAQESLGLLLNGEGYSAASAVQELGLIVESEFMFLRSQSTNLSGFAKHMYNKMTTYYIVDNKAA